MARGIFGDRNEEGARPTSAKSQEYFNHSAVSQNPEIKYAGDVADERAQKSSVPENDDNVLKRGVQGRTKTATFKGKSTSYTHRKSHRLEGTAINTTYHDSDERNTNDPFSPDFNPSGKSTPILGSETQYDLKGSGTEREEVNLKHKLANRVTFVNKKGKSTSAAGGTKQSAKLQKKYQKQEKKVKKSGYLGQEKTESGKIMNYKKGSIEYS